MNFVHLNKDNIDFFKKNIKDFFELNAEYKTFFHPHLLTFSALKDIILNIKNDEYILYVNDNEIIGYGILRGWDEGYTIPSLGIIISSKFRGQGFSMQLMNYLHQICINKGSEKIRLTVYKENTAAINLYNKLGYIFSEKNKVELIGIKYLKNV